MATFAGIVGELANNLYAQATAEKGTQVAALTCPVAPTAIPATSVCGLSSALNSGLANLATLTC